MNYLKYTFKITPNETAFHDVLSSELGSHGFESFEEHDGLLFAYIPEKDNSTLHINEVDFRPMFTYTFETELIPDQNWNEVWEKNYFKPLVIANQCVIRAPFHTDYPNLNYEIVIEPNMAFGTGNHETTMLMMEQILVSDLQNKTVLDMGCGTGILSILASMLGAKNITSIDINEWAYKGTIENASLNNTTNIEAFLGDASLLGTKPIYDIVLANIHKNVLIEDMPKYKSVLRKGGLILFSGIFKDEIDELVKVAEIHNLKKIASYSKEKWGLLIVKN